MHLAELKMFGSEYEVGHLQWQRLSSGYQPIEVVQFAKIADTLDDLGNEFPMVTHSGHPVAAAVALENLRIMTEEKIVDNVAKTAKYLKKNGKTFLSILWLKAWIKGMMGAIELSPDKNNKSPFKTPAGRRSVTRQICFEHGLIMRHVYDR